MMEIEETGRGSSIQESGARRANRRLQQDSHDDFLVTLLISVDRKHNIHSDVQTHDNSFSEVAKGFNVIKAELDRVLLSAKKKKCPYFPSDSAAAKRKIIRKSTLGEQVVQAQAEYDNWTEEKQSAVISTTSG